MAKQTLQSTDNGADSMDIINENFTEVYQALWYGSDAGGDDTYAVTLSPSPTSYVEGMKVAFKPTTANTGACTLDLNGLGAKSIKKNVAEDLSTGDIKAGQIVFVMYDGTNFQVVSGGGDPSSAIHAATEKTTPADADELGLIDSAASYVLKRLTVLGLKLAIYAGIKPAEGTMWNGKISVTDTGSGINVALKTLAGTDPSASDPVYITLGGAVRTITSALSVAKADGTNWCNAGSAEFATKEIDYFVYLGYNATDGVVIGFSRYPGANSYDDFSATTTNEKYCAISTITTAAATDYYEIIGRFAATLSAGAGYTWSVPTFTAKNLIQRPIYETREMDSVPTLVFGTIGNGTLTGKYKISSNQCSFLTKFSFGSTTSIGSGVFGHVLPFAAKSVTPQSHGSGRFLDTGTGHYGIISELASTTTLNYYLGSPSAQQLAGNYPVTMATNDSVTGRIVYMI